MLLAVLTLVAAADCAPCARSDSAYVHADAAMSLDWAVEGLERDSTNVALMWRAARGEIAMAILSSEDRPVIDARLERAIAFGRRGVQRAPNDPTARYWLAAALGRLAQRKGFRESARLAAESYESAQRILAIDSLHAGAHAIVGELNSELRNQAWIVRKVAAIFTGLAVAGTASFEEAERQLTLAIRLDPALLIARADLSELYLRMGRPAEALAVVKALEAMPQRTPVDAWLQRYARSRLPR